MKVARFLVVVLILSTVGVTARADDVWSLRGDADGSGGLGLSDAIAILSHLFGLPGEPLGCLAAADANEDGRVDVSDAVALLGYLFLAQPPPPTHRCAPPGNLGCEQYAACAPIGRYFLFDLWDDPAGSSRFKRAQSDAIHWISPLQDKDRFAVWSFGSDVERFPPDGADVPALATNQEAAIDWIMNLRWGIATVGQAALLDLVRMANQSPAQTKTIYVYTRGTGFHPTDEDFLESVPKFLDAVREANTQRIPINLPVCGYQYDMEWIRALAEQNGGTTSQCQ